jgi:hypothetical protein
VTKLAHRVGVCFRAGHTFRSTKAKIFLIGHDLRTKDPSWTRCVGFVFQTILYIQLMRKAGTIHRTSAEFGTLSETAFLAVFRMSRALKWVTYMYILQRPADGKRIPNLWHMRFASGDPPLSIQHLPEGAGIHIAISPGASSWK